MHSSVIIDDGHQVDDLSQARLLARGTIFALHLVDLLRMKHNVTISKLSLEVSFYVSVRLDLLWLALALESFLVSGGRGLCILINLIFIHSAKWDCKCSFLYFRGAEHRYDHTLC